MKFSNFFCQCWTFEYPTIRTSGLLSGNTFRSVTVTTFLDGNHLLNSFSQFFTRFGGHTTHTGYEFVFSTVAIACKVLPSPISSAINVLRDSDAYFTPARWYGRSGSPATSSSASVERDASTDLACSSFNVVASATKSSGTCWLNLSAHSNASVILLIGALHALVFACQVTLGICFTAFTFTGSYANDK